MDRVLGGRFLKMSCGLKSKYTRGPCGEAEPRQLPLLPALLHILIAFHLDRDGRVNAVSRVRTDETDRLRSTSVSETENKSLSAVSPSLVNPYPSNSFTFSVFESFG